MKSRRRRRRACHVWGKQRCIQSFGGETEGKRPLGIPRSRRQDNIKWIFKKLDGGMNWIDLAHERNRWSTAVNAVMNLRVQYNAGNFLAI
jgi:hypothetical protein